MSSTNVQDNHNRVAQLQHEVNEVSILMEENLKKEMERGGKLSHLETQTEQLNKNAEVFIRTSRKVKEKMWWQTTVAKIVIALIVMGIIFIVIIVPLAIANPSPSDSSSVDVIASVPDEVSENEPNSQGV